MSFEFSKEESKNEDKKLSEAPLSPEQIEKIMEKVQDIDTEGIAYSVFYPSEGTDENPSILKNILEKGLLGRDPTRRGGIDDRVVNAKSWVADVKTKRAVVHFNVVGRKIRSQDHKYKREIAESYYMTAPRDQMVVLFDVGSFEEEKPNDIDIRRALETGFVPRHKTFQSNDTSDVYNELEVWGRPMPDTEYGFVLFHRVPPRLFRGLISRNGKKVEETVKEMTEVYKDHPESLLPIYDIGGNLLWPEKMDYENIKKLVGEREKAENDPLEKRRPDSVE